MANNGPPGQLPPAQSAQMTSFSFAPPQAYHPPAETQQKSYVFVDEHNRHKRLKVMRACEGCRKRKIRCSAANTNTWPCTACVRLKLACVRPTSYDGSPEYDDQAPEARPEAQSQPPTIHPQPQQPQLQRQQPQHLLYNTTADFRNHQPSPLSPADRGEPPLPQQALYGVPPVGYTSAAGGDGSGSVSGVSVSGISGVHHLYAPQASLQHYGPGLGAAPQSVVTSATSYPAATSAAPYSTTPYQAAASLQQPQYQQQHQQQPQVLVQQDVAPSIQHDAQSTTDNKSGGYADDRESYAGSAAGVGTADLADLLGTLRMDEAGTAPYLSRRGASTAGGHGSVSATVDAITSGDGDGQMGDGYRASEAEAPVAVEADDAYESGLLALPPLVAGPGGLKIRIPPELMPNEETVQQSFALYFEHVHPYLPVLDRRLFYEQWRTQRDAVSPLLVEALLAVGGRLADDPAQGQQWLALATRHADAFMDVPRLSTLQALLILLKAREAAPKPGYYYRSWMTIVQCVQMAKDLGLDEHGAAHVAGRPCDAASLADCALKTRIWQTIFVCEVMIGSPQGRTELAVSLDTVDVQEPPQTETEVMDPRDAALARQFSYWLRLVANVARLNRSYGEARLRGVKDWGADPAFTQLTPLLHGWPAELPADLAVTYTTDGSPPWLPSPFVGHMHSYYYLSLLLLHRPQLQLLKPMAGDGRWKHHMCVCCTAAKQLCRLVEAILQMYGLGALQDMLRGINYTIYAVLTCLVVHLVALTSPDPDFSTDAREYFTRQMRVLEQCMNAWPMPAMQMQIDAVRKAFSADVRKPFVLKPSFPYGSPKSATAGPSAEQMLQQQRQQRQQQQRQQRQQQQQQQQQPASLSQQHLHPRHASAYADHHPMSPPVSVGPRSDVDSPLGNMMQAQAQVQAQQAQTQAQAQVQAQAQAQAQVQAQLQAQVQAQQAAAAESVTYDSIAHQSHHASTGTHTSTGFGRASDAPTWDPSRIFDQWNTTFGTGDIATPLHDLPLVDGLQQQQQPHQQQYPHQPQHHGHLNSSLAGMNPLVAAGAYPGGTVGSSGNNAVAAPAAAAAAAAQHAFVTPAMWQESVASVYEGGLGIKRAWDEE